MKQKTAIVDLDNTLICSEKLRESGQKKAVEFLVKELRKYSINTSFADYGIVKKQQYALFADGRATDKRMRFEMFLKKAGANTMERKNLVALAMGIYFKELGKFREYKFSSGFINALHDKGYKIVLYSHATTEEAFFKLRKMKSSTLRFVSRLYSTDKKTINQYPKNNWQKRAMPKVISIGMKKNARSYLFLKKKENAVMMFGNSEKHDIIPAQKAGLNAILVKNGNLRKALKSI
jgi:FMN phosphatase YigB (HAD superfamily)